MTAKQAVDEIRLSRVLFLLALSVFINYLDRGNLSIAAPLLKNDFQLSATQLGVLLSSFFWTYSFFLPVSGWLVDRFDVKWVLASGFFLWSAATAATGAVHAFGTLLLARLALGAGESVSYPACSTILSRYFPEHKRGFANASIVAGMALGPAFGTLAGGILMSRFGWRPVFLVVGLTTLLWLVPWLRWMPKGHRDSPSQSGLPAPGMLQILEQRSAWGTCVGLFCMNYLMYFLLTWLPFYLMHERHFSLAAMAKIAGLAYFLMAVAATSAGWVSDRCIASGKTLTLVRKTFMVVGQVGAGISLAACVVSGPALPVVCLLLAAAFWGISAGKWTRAAKLLRQSGWVDRACGDGFGRGQDGTILLGFHHHCCHRLVGLAVLDIYCLRPSTGGLVNSPGLRRFALISKHAAKAVGSEQTLSATVNEAVFIGGFVRQKANYSMQYKSLGEE